MADPTQTDAAGATRSDVWFEDGNIIILEEGTHFKIYRGALTAHSYFQGYVRNAAASLRGRRDC